MLTICEKFRLRLNSSSVLKVTSKKDQKQYWARDEVPYIFISAKEFAKAYESFHIGCELANQLAAPFDKSKGHPAALTTEKYGINKKELLKACISREFLLMKRNKFVYIFKLAQVSLAKRKIPKIAVLPF